MKVESFNLEFKRWKIGIRSLEPKFKNWKKSISRQLFKKIVGF
jgi:hypothetical protein